MELDLAICDGDDFREVVITIHLCTRTDGSILNLAACLRLTWKIDVDLVIAIGYIHLPCGDACTGVIPIEVVAPVSHARGLVLWHIIAEPSILVPCAIALTERQTCIVPHAIYRTRLEVDLDSGLGHSCGMWGRG